MKQQRAKDPDAVRARKRKYYWENREKVCAQHREHHRRIRASDPEKAREKGRESMRRQYLRDPEKFRKMSRDAARARRASDAAEVRKKLRQWHAANPGKQADYARRDRRKNGELRRERQRAAYRQRRAAAVLGVPTLVYAAMKVKDKFQQSQSEDSSAS